MNPIKDFLWRMSIKRGLFRLCSWGKRTAKNVLSSVDFWKILIPALVAVWTWHRGEISKIEWEQRKGREQSYQELLKATSGFYQNSDDDKRKQAFVEQVRICWLYAPDNVIRKAYAFLESVRVGQPQNQDEQKQKLGEFILSLREDMLSGKIATNTTLKATDYQHLGVNNQRN